MLRREARRLSNRIDKSQIRYSLKTLAHVNYLVQLDEVPYDTLTEAVERLVVDTN